MNSLSESLLKIAKEIFEAPDWTKKASGILFVCPKDKTIMLTYRSKNVDQPLTWGITGGGCEDSDTFECAKRETIEEIVYFPKKYKTVGKTIFKKDDFQFVTFIVQISKEEKTNILINHKLNWENEDLKFFSLYKLLALDNLHFGVKFTLNKLIPSLML